MRRSTPSRTLTLVTALVLCGIINAAEWSTYLGDVRRSGVSADAAPEAPGLLWVFTPPSPPSHAWADPQPKPVEGILELPHLRFDDAYHAVLGHGLVLFGSSSDHKVYALDARTGSIRWEFFTEGPIRAAPTLADDRVYVGSDDGFAYCLDADTGALQWRFAAGPTNEHVLGNGQMTSLWPIRTGVLVDGGTAYFGAGVFPAEGLYLHALNARTGKPIWENDSYGLGGNSDLSPQGYILLTEDHVILPSGRRSPMAFSRKDGRLLFSHTPSRFAVGTFGGTYTRIDGDILYNGTEKLFGYQVSNGNLVLLEYARRIAFTTDRVFLLTGTQLASYDKARWVEAGRKRLPYHQRLVQTEPVLNQLLNQRRSLEARQQPIPAQLQNDITQNQTRIDDAKAQQQALVETLHEAGAWEVPCTAVDALLVSRNAIVAGTAGAVTAFAPDDGRQLWQAAVPGRARGLALAAGRLVVSTDTGAVACFADTTAAPHRVSLQTRTPDQPLDTALAAALAPLSLSRGFALVLGPKALEATLPLTTTSAVKTYLADADSTRVDAWRHALNAAGVYGFRSAAVHAPDLANLPFSAYFANRVVWTSSEPPPAAVAKDILRVLKPWGGILLAPATAAAPFRTHVASLPLAERSGTGWIAFERGPLPGSGSWTHQYAEPGNTGCGDDQRVRGNLGVLWYGEPGPGQMANRHASAASPLAADGRLFIEGEDTILCYDSSNGVELWTRDLPGAVRLGLKTTCSNSAYAGGRLFVVAAGVLHCIDPADGKSLSHYRPKEDAEGALRPWGQYLGIAGGIAVGSTGKDALFAIDLATRQHLWEAQGQALDLITIAISDGRVFYVDRKATPDQEQAVLKGIETTTRIDRKGHAIAPDVRVVVCRDLRTGAIQWERPTYFSDCVKISSGGGELTLMAANGVILLCGQPWNGHFWQEFYAGDFSRRSLIALAADDGRELWSGRKGYRSRPIVVGDMIVAEPWAHDLKTGAERQRLNPLTGRESAWQFSRPGHHCGNIAACTNALFFRSGSAAYYDLSGDYGTAHFGGQRPGCWINCIPANGVVLMPEASSGCICPYSLQCTTAFAPRKETRMWGRYSAAGTLTPIQQLSLNFGAPGDRRDEHGTLWLAYPRPGQTRLVLPLNLKPEFAAGGSFVGSQEVTTATPLPDWIATSGARRLTHCRIPLLNDADGSALYTVTLHLLTTPGTAPGDVLCTVSLQDKDVATRIDLVPLAHGAGNIATLQFPGIVSTGDLDLRVSAASGQDKPPPDYSIAALEITREKVLHVGMAASDVLLSDAAPEATTTIRLANRTPRMFSGTLRVTPPQGFTAEPATVPINLSPDESLTVETIVKVVTKGEPLADSITFDLNRQDQSSECRRSTRLDYLGPRGRLTIVATADTHAVRGQPEKNYGAATTLPVDGGANEMGDASHARAFLRFPLDIPGKPLSVELHLFVPEGGWTQSNDSGVIRLIPGEWKEDTLTWTNQPEAAEQIGVLGKVGQDVWVVRPLNVDLDGRKALDIVIDPTSCDGATYDSREGPNKPRIVIEYEIEK